jgi:pimeloyl-ACP methyl ester carboxylesterase
MIDMMMDSTKTELLKFCAPGATFHEEMIPVHDQVSLRVITFTPPKDSNKPPVVFIAGWISLIDGWKDVLQTMTHDYKVIYIETREKRSSRVNGNVQYSVETIGKDIVKLIDHFQLLSNRYILFGSSLGATAILDCCRYLKQDPFCIVLLGPNAEFRIPWFYKILIYLFPPILYILMKPIIKWYLRTFRMDMETSVPQYIKYCRSIDAADPWKLKKAAISLWKYKVWDLLPEITYRTLLIGASKDKLHEPENIKKIVALLKNCHYIDLETNQHTHSGTMVKVMNVFMNTLKK